MDIKEFPAVIGWLTRSYSPRPRGGYSEVVYRLSGDLQGSRYQALREIVFSVTEGESSPFEVCVNGEPVAEVHSMEGVSVELQSALDREFIRAGILAVAPEKGQQEPDLAMFRNPQHYETEPLRGPGESEGDADLEVFRNPRQVEVEPIKRPGDPEMEVFRNPRHRPVEPLKRASDPDLEGPRRGRQ